MPIYNASTRLEPNMKTQIVSPSLLLPTRMGAPNNRKNRLFSISEVLDCSQF